MNAERIKDAFAENFSARGELGASVSIWRDGREILSLAGGFRDRERRQPWTTTTPVLFWSATKGLASGCVLHACQERQILLDAAVAEFWPEFAGGGKAAITIAQLLSHQAGLSSLDRDVPVLNYDAVVTALAEQAPRWPLGEGHGYHPRTFGFLLDELLRRITGGTPLREYWRRVFAVPLALDLWIGMPAEGLDKVAPVFPARSTPPKGDVFYTAFLTAGSLTARAFASPQGLHSAAAMNTPEARSASLAGFGGIGTASALAKYYAMLANGGFLEGRRFFDPPALEAMMTTLVQGQDRVLLLETAFSAGFMKDPVGPDGRKLHAIFGPSLRAFGQPGAGGSHAFADPENRLSFAYVMNQMEPGVLPNEKSLRLIEEMYRT
jgi:CubicO group peptidase (beta-lactamase class C family)